MRSLSLFILLALFTGCTQARQPEDYDGYRLSEAQSDADAPLRWSDLEDVCFHYLFADASIGAIDRDLWYEYYLRHARKDSILVGSIHRFQLGQSISAQIENMRGAARRSTQDLTPMVSFEDCFAGEHRISDSALIDTLRLFLPEARKYYGRYPVICLPAAHYSPTLQSFCATFHVCLTDCDPATLPSILRDSILSPLQSTPCDSTPTTLPLPLTGERGRGKGASYLIDTHHHLHRLAPEEELRLRYPREMYFAADDSLPDGIDVSKYQKQIRWNEVAASGIRYAICRATHGVETVDPTYQTNIREARRAGLLVTGYHFFSTRSSAREQFFAFLRNTKRDDWDLPPMLDIEEAKMWQGQRLRDSVDVWISLCEQYLGVRPMIYSYQNFYNDHLDPFYSGDLLFLARYAKTPATIQSRGKAALWQYASDGHIPGIDTLVDLSKLHQGIRLEDYLLQPFTPDSTLTIPKQKPSSAKKKKKK